MELKDLTEEQKASMKVKHYVLHIPATAAKQQIDFIQEVAHAVLNNEPITIVQERTMQFLLRMVYSYRNILTEFDEQDRWTERDDDILEQIKKGFQPILDWLVEEYKINIGKFRRD